MTIAAGGRRCLCGNQGCWEEYASDRALVRLYLERTGTAAGAQAIVERARGGEAAALEALNETAGYLGLGLANLIMGLNPEAIFLDSWGAAGWDLLKGPVWTAIRGCVPASWLEGVQVRPSAHTADASLRGAVALALSRFFLSFVHSGAESSGTRVLMQT